MVTHRLHNALLVLPCLFLFLGVLPMQAQEAASLERLLETVAQESEVSPTLDAIDDFANNPLSLPSATVKDLLLIPGFSPTTARNILRMVRTATTITYDTLQQALGLSPEQMMLLRLCTSLAKKPAKISAMYRLRTRYNLTESLGIEQNLFEGSPLDVYQRATLTTSWIKVSVTLQKDEGEISIADFVSASAHLIFPKTDIILGDYTVQSGMGSLLWQQFGARKGPDVLSPAVQVVSTIRPYHSSIEQDFFRGIALQREFSLTDSARLTTAAWYSTQQRSATIDSTGTAVALDADGYFRTPTEIQNRNNLTEQAMGTTIDWRTAKTTIGASLLGLRYSHPITSQAQTAFAGKEGILGSVYGTVQYDSFVLACEGTRDARGALGFRAGLQRSDAVFRYALAFRSFASDFRSPFGYSFGESNQPSNETGVYIAVDWKPFRSHHVRFYTDLYRSPTPTFSVPTPIRGLDLFAEYSLALTKKTDLAFRLHREDKTDALTRSDGIRLAFQRVRTDIRFDIAHALSSSLHTHFRCHAVHVAFQQQQPDEIGIVVVGDLNSSIDNTVGIASHIAVFSTPTFASALWAYEPAIAGTMSAPALFGEGIRGVLRLRYTPTTTLTMWLQAAITEKNHVDELGSGVTAVAGNTDSQLQLQLDYTW